MTFGNAELIEHGLEVLRRGGDAALALSRRAAVAARVAGDDRVAVLERGDLLAPHVHARSEAVDQRHRGSGAFLEIVDGLAVGAQHGHASSPVQSQAVQRGDFAAGNAAGDEALGDIAAGEIKVPERAAEFACRIEPRDRLVVDVDDLLLRIVHRPALGVRHHRPHLAGVERRRRDRHHVAAGTAEFLVLLLRAHRVPARDRVVQRRAVAADDVGQLVDGVRLLEDAELDLLEAVAAPGELDIAVVVGRVAERVAAPAGLVADHVRRNAREGLRHRVEHFERTRALILHIGRQLVHEALAGLVDQDPRGLHQREMLLAGNPVGKTLHADRERIVRIGVLEAVGAVEVPHVPELRAELLRHLDAVAGVAAAGGVDHRRHLPVLALHLLVGLEAAAGEDDALARLDAPLAVLALDDDADHLLVGVGDQRFGRGRKPDLDRELVEIVLQYLEHHRPAGTAAGVRIGRARVEIRNCLDLRVVERLDARQRIVAAALAHENLGVANLRQIAEIGLDLGHALRERLQHIVAGAAGIGRPQIVERLVRLPRRADRAVGADRDAAGIRHLLDQQDAGAAPRRLDRRNAAGKAVTDHDDVECLIELRGRFLKLSLARHSCYRLPVTPSVPPRYRS